MDHHDFYLGLMAGDWRFTEHIPVTHGGVSPPRIQRSIIASYFLGSKPDWWFSPFWDQFQDKYLSFKNWLIYDLKNN